MTSGATGIAAMQAGLFTIEGMAHYLAQRLGGRPAVEQVTQFPRGTSRDTWFIDYRAAPDGPIKTLVFRLDHAAGSVIPSPLDLEYFIYARLGQTDVPVAKALWWEDDLSWLGRPFFVRAHVEGNWQIPHYRDPDPHYDALRIATAKEHLRTLARLHRVDWRALGFHERLAAPPSPDRCGETYIAVIEQTLATYGREPLPIFVEAAEWLRERAPTAPAIVLCKGTNGLGEEVFRDGRIVALSDWEEASIGDPASDLAFMQTFADDIVRDGATLWSIDHAIAYYREISGIPVTREAVDFYRLIQCFKTLSFTNRCGAIVHDRSDVPPRHAWTATEVSHVFKRILAGAMGLMPPPQPSWFAELNQTVEETAA